MKPAWKYLLLLTVFLTCLVPNLRSQAPANFDFELSSPGTYTTANAVAGWTVESAVNSTSFGGLNCNSSNTNIVWSPGSPEFSVLATPVPSVPYIGTLTHSPLGGNLIARLNNHLSSGGLITRIKNQFSVGWNTSLFNFAFATSLDGVHQCCEQPAFLIDFYTCTATPSLIPSLSRTLTPGSNQCVGITGYSITGMTSWSNWQVLDIDISPFAGQCLQVVISIGDCVYGQHHASAFVDLALTTNLLWFTGGGIVPTGAGNAVSFCLGSNQAAIQGPSGYSSYQWIAPGNVVIPPPQGTAQLLSISNPISNSVYTLLSSSFNFTTQHTYTIVPSQVNIAGLGTSSVCNGGSNGSATVVANGSGTGFNYTWLNSSSIAIGTSSTISNLPVGNYSIVVSAAGNTACGTAIGSLSIGAISPSISAIPMLCQNSQNYTVSASPPGGIFSSAFQAPSYHNMIINPSSLQPGSYTFTYSVSHPNCLSAQVASFQIGGPLITISGSTVACSGQSIQLQASGASSYSWNIGANTSTISVSPNINTVYTVSASHTVDPCVSSQTFSVFSNQTPTLLVTGNTNLCLQQSTTLQASGATTYTWNTGQTSSSISVTPSITTVYTLSGSSPPPYCISQKTLSVFINPGPPIQIAGPTLVCIGEPFSLIATGASSYTWHASQATWSSYSGASTLSTAQAVTNVYTLSASSVFSNPCIAFKTFTVDVSPCLGNEEKTENMHSILLSPNPSSGIFTIESAADLEIRVYNVLGQFLFTHTTEIGMTELNLMNYPNGIYFVQLVESPRKIRVIKSD